MKCESCTHTRRAKKESLAKWLADRGLAFCWAESKLAGQQIIVDMNNVAGPVCGGKKYEPKTQLRDPTEANTTK